MGDVPPQRPAISDDTALASHPNLVLDEVRVVVAGAAEDVRHSAEVVRLVGAALRVAWRQLGEVEHEALVAQVVRESTHVSHLADRLLQVACLDPAAYRSQPEVIDLNGYLLARFSDRMLEPPDIRLSSPTKVSVVADKDHVWQIVQFLIDAVLVLVEPPMDVVLEKDDDWVVFCFTGISLEQEDVAGQLFEPTSALSPGAERLPSLWFPRQLARANGGDVWYDANGSAILLRLPAGG